jgi:hypothetical protein
VPFDERLQPLAERLRLLALVIGEVEPLGYPVENPDDVR